MLHTHEHNGKRDFLLSFIIGFFFSEVPCELKILVFTVVKRRRLCIALAFDVQNCVSKVLASPFVLSFVAAVSRLVCFKSGEKSFTQRQHSMRTKYQGKVV